MEILFQDEDLIVVSKPAGLLTIRDGYNPNLPTVKSLLENEFGHCWIVHRLDKETSGVLIVARNELSHRSLNLSFQNRLIKKMYHAIIVGIPGKKEFVIDQPIKVNGDRKHRTIIDPILGKPAKSAVKVINSFSHYSLVSIEPATGYTHQIRAHLAYGGFPILGDKLYQKNNGLQHGLTNIMDRTALHAFQISLIHPTTKLLMTIQAIYPEDFNKAIASLT